MGCDVSALSLRQRNWISIHAPTWGATAFPLLSGVGDQISIHAPTWGATKVINKVPVQIPFQSTHPRGVRPDGVSALSLRQNFNPRTHVGCDPECLMTKDLIDHFNPRTHVGCDGGKYAYLTILEISIHAPTWGATYLEHVLPEVHGISIHAPTWGATLYTLARVCQYAFQSTHPRGVRPRARNSLSPFVLFQSTHPRGVRPDKSLRDGELTLFQSTHPRGVRR